MGTWLRGLLLVAVAALGIGLATTGAQAACFLTGAGSACKGGISVVTLLVTDQNWKSKWRAATGKVPQFKTTGRLGKGDTATLLTFFAADKSGPLSLTCDVTVKYSKGKPERVSTPCFRGNVQAGSIYLTGLAPTVGGYGEVGTGDVTVSVKTNRGTRITTQTRIKYTK